MKALLQLAAALALLTFAMGAAVFFYDSHRLISDADTTIKDLDSISLAFHADVEGQIAHVDSILVSARQASEQMRLAAIEQRAYWQKTSADSDKTVKALRLTIDRAGLLMKHTDEELNASLLPDVDREVVLTSETAQMSMASFGHAGDVLAFQLDDPNIDQLAAHLNESSAHISDATGHLDKATADIEQAVHRLTRPPSLAKRVGMALLDMGAKLGSIAAGFVR